MGALARLLGGLSAMALSGAASSALAQTAGIAAAVVNDVKVSNAAAPAPRPVVVRQQVALADRIATGQRSYLQILLLDRTTFSVGANARVTIDRFVYDPARGRDFGSSVAKGAFRFLSGQRSPQRSATIRSPIASIGIRGTILEGVVGTEAVALAKAEGVIDGRTEVDPATATLVVLRGPGLGNAGNAEPGLAEVSAGGQVLRLDQPSMAVFVGKADRAPIGPFALSRKGLERLQDLVFPSLAAWRRSGRWFDPPGRMGGGGWDTPPPFEP